jgi:hypothetical protein
VAGPKSSHLTSVGECPSALDPSRDRRRRLQPAAYDPPSGLSGASPGVGVSVHAEISPPLPPLPLPLSSAPSLARGLSFPSRSSREARSRLAVGTVPHHSNLSDPRPPLSGDSDWNMDNYQEYLAVSALSRSVSSMCRTMPLFWMIRVLVMAERRPSLHAVVSPSSRCAPALCLGWTFLYLLFFRLVTWFGLPAPTPFANAIQLLLTLKVPQNTTKSPSFQRYISAEQFSSVCQVIHMSDNSPSY